LGLCFCISNLPTDTCLICFLFVRLEIYRLLPSVSPCGGHPCLWVTLPTIKARSGLSPQSLRLCRAHKENARFCEPGVITTL
jgi:hypothetical protein